MAIAAGSESRVRKKIAGAQIPARGKSPVPHERRRGIQPNHENLVTQIKA
jgi:hypothetical protein